MVRRSYYVSMRHLLLTFAGIQFCSDFRIFAFQSQKFHGLPNGLITKSSWEKYESIHTFSSMNQKEKQRFNLVLRESRNVNKASEESIALDDFNQILEAVRLFGELYGDFEIPSKFEVPSEPNWPTELHGLRLGRRLEKLLSSTEFISKHSDKADMLMNLGYRPSSDPLVDDWALIIKALKLYKELYGNLRVASKFVVPDSDPWPRLTRNMKLGVRVAAIRSTGRFVRGHPERKAELDELGFEWRVRDHTHKQQIGEETFQQVFEALQIYKSTIDQGLYVPEDFVVPETSQWSQDLYGLKLGLQVKAIIEEEKFVYGYEDRVVKLNELGFPWDQKSPNGNNGKRFDIVYDALVEYKRQYGDLVVPASFVVPSSPPWPSTTWGLKLGNRVNAIRMQGTFIVSSPKRRYLPVIRFITNYTTLTIFCC